MHNEEPPGLRHTREGRHPTLIHLDAVSNGMTDSVHHLDSRVRGNDASSRPPMEGIPSIFIFCRRAQAHEALRGENIFTVKPLRTAS